LMQAPSGVFGPLRCEHIEIEHRFVAHHLAPVHGVGGHHQQAAGAQQGLPVADMKTEVKVEMLNPFQGSQEAGWRLSDLAYGAEAGSVYSRAP